MNAPPTSKSSATRNRLLDAAEQVVSSQGASALTLEAVAAEAGVSKGGLLYHFPSKDALASALVRRVVDGVDHALVTASADGSPGAFTRAYIQVTMGEPGHVHTGPDSMSTALLGALALDPGLLAPLKSAYERWQARLEADGLPEGIATLVRLAVDGWWTSLVLDLPPLSGKTLTAVRRTLDELARG
ncbi:TetR/AcrR family transcriptional regulator [Catenulispora yoronensis]|uniref:TetR/AcrR family transcriptional regulator n=1 Tax=Catenulispora yoronensis TaxID=450799 RepID=A0ABN2TVV4_9ACTN